MKDKDSYYEMDDVERELVVNAKEAISCYESYGSPSLDETEMIEMLKLLLNIVDNGFAV